MSTNITEILPSILGFLIPAFILVPAVLKIIRDNRQLKSAEDELDEAEKQGLPSNP
jgi:hypothetical protein